MFVYLDDAENIRKSILIGPIMSFSLPGGRFYTKDLQLYSYGEITIVLQKRCVQLNHFIM